MVLTGRIDRTLQILNGLFRVTSHFLPDPFQVVKCGAVFRAHLCLGIIKQRKKFKRIGPRSHSTYFE